MLRSGIKSASAQSYTDKCGADRQSGKNGRLLKKVNESSGESIFGQRHHFVF
jgi:hypothetical protein